MGSGCSPVSVVHPLDVANPHAFAAYSIETRPT